MADVTISITFDSSYLEKIARGIDPHRYEEEPPTTIVQATLFIKRQLIDYMKVAHSRGDKAVYADGYVPEAPPEPNL